MDKQSLALFIPILALSIPVIALVFHGLQKTARLRLEELRLKLDGGGSSAQEIEALRGEMDDMRRELGEVQERLDFAERLLARPEVRDRAAAISPEQPRSASSQRDILSAMAGTPLTGATSTRIRP